MPTACVEEGDSVLEWGYLLQGCGLTRLLGPSLYLWASFWNCGAKSRTVLKKKNKIAGHKNHRDIINAERARRTEPHPELCTWRSFWSSSRNGVGKREDQEVLVGRALALSWQTDWNGSCNPHMDDSSLGGTAVSAALQGALHQVQRAALGPSA